MILISLFIIYVISLLDSIANAADCDEQNNDD